MDLYCPVCSEPWENDTFHELAPELHLTYAEVAADFRRRGCEALNERHNVELQREQESRRKEGKLTKAGAASILYELLGEDMDGAASELDDAEFLGLI